METRRMGSWLDSGKIELDRIYMYRTECGIESTIGDRMSLWNLFDQFLTREGRKNRERAEKATISWCDQRTVSTRDKN